MTPTPATGSFTRTPAETRSATAAMRSLAMRKAYAVNRLLALGRAVLEGNLDHCLRQRRGERIPLLFPEMRSTALVISAPEEIGMEECDVRALESRRPSVGPLAIVGFLEGFLDAHDGDDRCLFLVSASSAVYIYDPSPCGGLYRLANSMVGFMRRGLRRFDGVYREPGYVESVFCVPITGDLGELGRLPADLDEVALCAGLTCTLLWPEGFDFVFNAPAVVEDNTSCATVAAADIAIDDTEWLNEEQSALCSNVQLWVFGHFGPARLSGIRRTAVFAAKDGSIYAFNRAALRLLRLAESITMFYRIGLRRFYRNYRQFPNHPGDEDLFLDPE